MSRLSRRAVLGAGAVLVESLAGCSSSPSVEYVSPGESEAFDTTPADVPPAEWVSAGASVSSEATPNHPLRLELTLTNEASRPLAVSDTRTYGPLVYFPSLTGRTGSAVLVPRDNDRVFTDGEPTWTGECWRFVTSTGDPVHIGVMSGRGPVAVDPDETAAVRHDVYFRGDTEECFPAGNYRGAHVLDLTGANSMEKGPYVLLQYVLSIGTDGPPSITVRGPEQCDSIRSCNRERNRFERRAGNATALST